MLLTVKEAANILNIPEKALRELMSARALPFVKLSPRRTRIREADVEAFLKKRTVRPI